MVAILLPLGVVGYFRYGWKQIFHVDPPFFADGIVGALVIIGLLTIAVDEFRKRRRGRISKFKWRRIFTISMAGGALVGILIAAIEFAGLGVNRHQSAMAAVNTATASSGVGPRRRAHRLKRSATATQPAIGATGADAIITQRITVRGQLTLPAGTMLYRVAELQYPYNRMVFDRPTTWFVLGANTCAQYPDTDCSTPIAVPDAYWKATAHGTAARGEVTTTSSAG